jgi:hypothetical protein
MKTRRTLSIVSTVVAVIAMASLWLAGAASAAAPAPAPIVVKAQDCCDAGIVVVDSAVAAQDGWLGIFRDQNGSIGSLVGYVPVAKGQNGPLRVDVESKRIGQAAILFAGFLVDQSGTGIFGSSTVALAPNSPIVAFATQTAVQAAAPAAAPAAPMTVAAPAAPMTVTVPVAPGPIANQISIKSQDPAGTGMAVVDSAMAAQDGWLGIFKSPSGAIGSLVGYAPVHKGQNAQFTADVDSKRTESAAALWAGLIVDESGTGMFNVNSVALAPNSPIVAFATTTASK